MNGLENIETLLDPDGNCPDPGTFDLAAGNPPYYSDHKIAEIFLQGALRALKPEGRVLMVTKSPAWFETRMPEIFDSLVVTHHNHYTVLGATQRG